MGKNNKELQITKDKKKSWKDSWLSILVAVLIAVGLRTFLAEPFSIPSTSMVPSLLVGDYLYVSKYSYGYSRYSFPFGPPLFKGRILGTKPETGQVAVFMGARDPDVRYIKRVIGTPGDIVEIKKGVVYINGKEATQKRIEDYVEKTVVGRHKRVAQYIETLPNGVEHKIIREDPTGMVPEDNMGPFHVPENHYFMLGDNRNGSGDSRFPSMGYIPYENFVGPAQFIFFSIDSSILDIWKVWEWGDIIRGKRIFKWIT